MKKKILIVLAIISASAALLVGCGAVPSDGDGSTDYQTCQ